MVVEVWSKEENHMKIFQKSVKATLKHGSILCMVVISFVHIVLFHLQEVKNEAVDLKTL